MNVKATIFHPNGDESIFKTGTLDYLLSLYPPAFYQPSAIVTEVDDAQVHIYRQNWNALESLVWDACATDDRDGLSDWLQNGSYDGAETIASLAADWDAVCAEADNL